MAARAARVPFLLVAFAAMPAAADLYAASMAHKRGDFPTAYAAYRELAELGQPVAQINVATMHARGLGVAQDIASAYAWASIAAQNGQPKAQTLAEEIRPLLTPQLLEKANAIRSEFGRESLEARLLPKAVDGAVSDDPQACRAVKVHRPPYPEVADRGGIQGDVYAEYVVMPDGRARQLRITYSTSGGLFDQAVRESLRRSTFEPAIIDGKAVPCTRAIFYRISVDDLKVGEYDGASRWLKDSREAAEKGDVRAQTLYGMMIAGLPRLDRPAGGALPWFLKAAQAGDPLAQYHLGTSLINGWDCEPDERKGVLWLRKAADRGHAESQVALARYLLRGSPDEQNVKHARTWLERAAASGDADAKLSLSALLATASAPGVGDPARALGLLKQLEDLADDPLALEIQAAAAAGSGDFDGAVAAQTKAITAAKALGWDVAPQEQRLARYREKQPWHGDLLTL